MCCRRHNIIAILLLLAWAGLAHADRDCNTRFLNPVTDICWSCSFPIKIGSGLLQLSVSSSQEDTPNQYNNNLPACNCGLNVGKKVSFWEPIRHIEVVRKPFCMPTLGKSLNINFDAPGATQTKRDDAGASSFYQAHMFVDPALVTLEAVLDSPCLENEVFDMTYATEFDPLWDDDEITSILNPDVFLFSNIAAQIACGADCVASTAGFGTKSLFWCAGCQGSLYPLNGHVAAHVGGVQASSLIATRLLAKLHRQMMMWAASGEEGMCGPYMQIVMDKTNYKYQMTHPVPQGKNDGRCCQPLGRSTVVWGSNKEIPNTPFSDGGEDFSYMIFRKRNCCEGAF